MGKALGFSCTLVAALAMAAACTVHQTTQPALTGPSELAQTVRITATPDSISQDGSSQSSILVSAFDSNGRPLSGLSVRLDMQVGGVTQDFGTLLPRSVVTGADGTARSIFTAPPAPPPSSGGTGTRVSIVATPLGSNFETALPQSVEVRLVPPGVILPPAGTPKASFVSSPTPASVNVSVSFDASASCAETDSSGACTTNGSIASFSWNFGDGATGSGKAINHTFTAASAFTVTLTVVNSRGVAASTSQTITANFISNPTAKFEFSPSTPVVGQTIVFDAAESKAATGHQIVSYSWNFGDGASAGGTPVSHAFATAGTYNVTLTVVDDTGLSATSASAVNVGTGNPTAVLTVNKTGGNSVFADASASTATTPATITSYTFIWGDGSTDIVPVASGSSKAHTYGAPGTYTVTLRVTDSVGRVGSTTQNVTVP